MLRRPGDCQALLLEEGCSSTAICSGGMPPLTVWNNPANRGSVRGGMPPEQAVP
jgi:hypothetical protein